MNDKEQASNRPNAARNIFASDVSDRPKKGTLEEEAKEMVTKRSFSAVRPPHVMTKCTCYCCCFVYEINEKCAKNRASLKTESFALMKS